MLERDKSAFPSYNLFDDATSIKEHTQIWQLWQLQEKPAKKKYRPRRWAVHLFKEAVDDEKLQSLDRKTCWMMFLFFSNFLWLQTLTDIYGEDVSADSFEFVTGRTKIFDLVKAFKYQVLTAIEVSLVSIRLLESWLILLGTCSRAIEGKSNGKRLLHHSSTITFLLRSLQCLKFHVCMVIYEWLSGCGEKLIS